MKPGRFWNSEDLRNPGSRGWKGRFANWVHQSYPDLGVYAVVGVMPRPMCFVYPRDFADLVTHWRNEPGETSRGERWALCCSRAKFAVFVGSGRPELTWGVASRRDDHGDIGFGFYVENGYERLPPEKAFNPFRDEGIEHRFFVRDDTWDWSRFRSSILDDSNGRNLVTEIMRKSDRPLFLRVSPADPDVASSARRYSFAGGQLLCCEETSPESAVATTESEMWDWLRVRADHETAWLDLILLDFARYTQSGVDTGAEDRLRLLLDAVSPLLQLCWPSG